MSFDPALWDDSDPFYAPCLKWQRDRPIWRAPARYVKAGYSIKSRTLTGTKGDGKDLDRAAICRDMTREMVRWWEGLDARPQKVGTIGWIIQRYLTDDFSPIQEVAPKTRKSYVWGVEQWSIAVSAVKLEDVRYETLMGWKQRMQQNGRSTAYIHRQFNTLRRVIRYGETIGDDECRRLAGVLSNMRIKAPAPRTVAPTRAQIEAIVAASDEAGHTAFSLVTLMQFWFALRRVDVAGHVVDGVWSGGLCWEHFDSDLTSFAKVINKIKDAMPDPYVFDLTQVTDIRDRLLALRASTGRIAGPLFVNAATGRPLTDDHFAKMWAKFRKAAGVESNVQMRDMRAGAITDATRVGVDSFTLRNAAQHKSVSTTDRYARGRSNDANAVVRLRREK